MPGALCAEVAICPEREGDAFRELWCQQFLQVLVQLIVWCFGAILLEESAHSCKDCVCPLPPLSLLWAPFIVSMYVPTYFCFMDTISVIFVACHIDGYVGSPIALLVIFGEG